MLNAQQLVTLRAAVIADGTAGPLLAAGNAAGLREHLNALASPPYTLWRTHVTQDEIMLNGFDWTRVDNLSNGAARVWEWLFDNEAHAFNPSKPNVRAGVDQVWKGTAADLAVRAAVYVHCKRLATNAEKMMTTGVGSDAVPSMPVYEGEISDLDSARVIFKDDGTIWN